MLFDSSLFQMAEHFKLPGPVQIHNTTGTLEKEKKSGMIRFGR